VLRRNDKGTRCSRAQRWTASEISLFPLSSSSPLDRRARQSHASLISRLSVTDEIRGTRRECGSSRFRARASARREIIKTVTPTCESPPRETCVSKSRSRDSRARARARVTYQLRDRAPRSGRRKLTRSRRGGQLRGWRKLTSWFSPHCRLVPPRTCSDSDRLSRTVRCDIRRDIGTRPRTTSVGFERERTGAPILASTRSRMNHPP